MTTAPATTGGLDDVMMAMDVVDTLRHRQHIVDKELDAAGREAALIKRLREIYHAQGIEVPDHILREGVQALEEQRFTYSPPEPSLSVKLAKLYITRDKWLKPVGVGLAVLIAATATYQFGVAGPQRDRAAAIERELNEVLPEELDTIRTRIQTEADEDKAIDIANAYFRDGMTAIEEGDVKSARAAKASLVTLGGDLDAEYDVTIVSRPGEMSGVFRIPDDVPDARNYYLIVEAIDARGRAIPVTITSEEDQQTKRVSKWGQRVTQGVFNAVSADKQDDQIIQDAIIGRKGKGRVTPDFSVAVEDGAILEW